MVRRALPSVVLLTLAAAPLAAQAHFALLQPKSWWSQNTNGDPQKVAPCGSAVDGAQGAATGVITEVAAGSTLTIRIDERIFHPGHYRVALAVNDWSELPPPPPVTAGMGTNDCGSVPIDDTPDFPILADGMLQHTSAFSGPQEFEVTLPADVTCEKCTLQVIEWMAQHGDPCFYYHCADLKITKDGPPPDTGTTIPIDSGTTGGGTTTTDTTTHNHGDTDTGDGEAAAGCGCASSPSSLAGLGALPLAFALIRRRRQS